MLLLVAKVRTCTTNFGTENETPSIRQSCSEEIKLLSGKCHTQALGCSLINTHLQKTRSQQKVPVIWPAFGQAFLVFQMAKKQNFKNLRDSVILMKRKKHATAIVAQDFVQLPAVSPLVLDIGSLPWCRFFQILYQLEITRIKRPQFEAS